MNDVFSENTEDPFAGVNEFVQSSEPSGGSIIPPMEQSDSAATPPLGQPTDQGQATAPDQGQSSGGTEQVSPDAQAGEQPLAEAELQKLEQEAEAVLADERTPAWYKNIVKNVWQPKIEASKALAGQYEALGTTEDLTKAVSMRTALGEIRSDPNTGMPVRTTEGFVKALYEEDPGGAYQLMSDLALLPSPITQGLTVTQELLRQSGIDPTRLADVQKFAQNGYSMTASSFATPDAEDLAQIPEKYHSTFSKLDPDTRESLLADNENVRNGNLEAHRVRQMQDEANSSTEEQQRTQAEQVEASRQAQFKQAVDQKGLENFTNTSESIMNTFVESLTKQAGMSSLDAMMVANTVVNAMEPTLAGRMSLEALKASGIEIDAQAPAIINKIEELSKHAAYYQLVGDQQSLQNVVADISEQQEKLIAKSNKIIASLASKRGASMSAPGQQLNQQLSSSQTSRHALAGVSSMNGVNSGLPQARMDFSEESYEADIRNDPFFRK